MKAIARRATSCRHTSVQESQHRMGKGKETFNRARGQNRRRMRKKEPIPPRLLDKRNLIILWLPKIIQNVTVCIVYVYTYTHAYAYIHTHINMHVYKCGSCATRTENAPHKNHRLIKPQDQVWESLF